MIHWRRIFLPSSTLAWPEVRSRVRRGHLSSIEEPRDKQKGGGSMKVLKNPPGDKKNAAWTMTLIRFSGDALRFIAAVLNVFSD